MEYEKHPTICNVCGGKVILINTGFDYDRGDYIYKCVNCGASVGTHPKTIDALGTLANNEMKLKRREVHVWFDRLWNNHQEREELYCKLAKELQIEKEECHFALMSMEMLDKTLEIVKKWWLAKYDI